MPKMLVIVFLLGLMFSVLSGRAAPTRILFLTNTHFKVSHTKLTNNLLLSHGISRDSADKIILSRIGYCTFLNNDTAHFCVIKKSLEQINASGEKTYSFLNYDQFEVPHTRPQIDYLEDIIKIEYDYIICLNKVDLIHKMGSEQVRYWFSIYTKDFTEIMSSKYTSKVDFSEGMAFNTFTHVLHQPSAAFEERVLNAIEHHQYTLKEEQTSVASSWLEGKMLLANEDTLVGSFRYLDPFTVHFRLSPESPRLVIKAHDMQWLETNTETFKSIFVAHIGGMGKYTIGKQVSKGRLNMYQIGDKYHRKFYIYDTKRDLTQRVRLSPDETSVINKKHILPFFEDSPTLKVEINAKKVGVKDLQKLVYLYNRSN